MQIGGQFVGPRIDFESVPHAGVGKGFRHPARKRDQVFGRAALGGDATRPQIAAQFRALKNAQAGSADAVIHSAYPIEGQALADLAATLQKRFGRPLNVSVQLDPSLIGGGRGGGAPGPAGARPPVTKCSTPRSGRAWNT